MKGILPKPKREIKNEVKNGKIRKQRRLMSTKRWGIAYGHDTWMCCDARAKRQRRSECDSPRSP